VVEHPTLIEKGAKFSHLSDGEKDDILRLARELRDSGLTLTEVSKRIATQLARSPEAVRYTIKNYDRVHPDHALFPAVVGPLSSTAKEQIFQAKQQLDLAKQKAKLTGDTVEDTVTTIAKQFGRTRSSMYRVVNEVRAKELVRTAVDYIYNAE